MIKEVESFDKKMEVYFHINLKEQYRKSKIYLRNCLLLSTALVTVSIIGSVVISIDGQYQLLHLNEFVLYTAPTVINTFIDLQFCTLLLLLKQRFEWLNKKFIIVNNNLNGGFLKSGKKVYSVMKL